MCSFKKVSVHLKRFKRTESVLNLHLDHFMWFLQIHGINRIQYH